MYLRAKIQKWLVALSRRSQWQQKVSAAVAIDGFL